MVELIKNIYYRQQFFPNFLSIFINSGYIIRKGLLKGIKKLAPELKGRLLDFGCGRKPYKRLFNVDEYIGVDIEVSGHSHTTSNIDVYYDGKTIPFPNDYFDSVFCSEVLEHLFEPELIFKEIHRVLKPEGRILLTVPFTYPEHEVPYDYGRYSSLGLKYFLEKNGFEVNHHIKSTTFFLTVTQLNIEYLTSNFFPKSPLMKLPLNVIFVAPYLIISLLLNTIMPDNKKFYCNNIVLAKKSKS